MTGRAAARATELAVSLGTTLEGRPRPARSALPQVRPVGVVLLELRELFARREGEAELIADPALWWLVDELHAVRPVDIPLAPPSRPETPAETPGPTPKTKEPEQ